MSTDKPLRVLITNMSFANRSGTETYTKDLALELLREGHSPIVYSPKLGRLAEQMIGRSINVVNDLGLIGAKPDVIHGHHCLETMAALLHFPKVPAVFVCHDAQAWHDTPPDFPRIRRYIGVDVACRDRMILREGIPVSKTSIHSNAFDLSRYQKRESLPDRPQSALLISNYVDRKLGKRVLQNLKAMGIETRLIGRNFGTETETPEELFAKAHLVLAKGRCAWEALVSGAAVIPLDAQGMGSLVTPDNYQYYSQCNFGRRILLDAISAARLTTEVQKYCSTEAIGISKRARADAALADRTKEFVAIYREIIREEQESPSHPDEESVASGKLFCWWASNRDQHVKQRVKEKRMHRVAGRIINEGFRQIARATARNESNQ